MQNRDMNVRMNRLQDELNQARSGNLEGSGTLPYSHQKAKAKADAEAVADVAKYKKLYTAGAERLGRVQQENDMLAKEVERLRAAKGDLQAKVGLLEDQVKSFRKSVRSCVTPALTARHDGAPDAIAVSLASNAMAIRRRAGVP